LLSIVSYRCFLFNIIVIVYCAIVIVITVTLFIRTCFLLCLIVIQLFGYSAASPQVWNKPHCQCQCQDYNSNYYNGKELIVYVLFTI